MHVYKNIYRSWFKLFVDGVQPLHLPHKGEDWLVDHFFSCHDAEDQALGDPMYFTTIDNYIREKVTPHKVAVFKEGIKLYSTLVAQDGSIANYVSPEEFMHQLFVHDLSKYSVQEVFGYAFYDFGGSNTQLAKDSFQRAWAHHKQVNAHHPEHWYRDDETEDKMPKKFIIEMLADWLGAGKTYGTPFKDWAVSERGISSFFFHKDTVKYLRHYLQLMGMDVDSFRFNERPSTANTKRK